MSCAFTTQWIYKKVTRRGGVEVREAETELLRHGNVYFVKYDREIMTEDGSVIEGRD